MPTRSSPTSRRVERATRAPSQAAFVDALLDPSRPVPSGLVAWNGSDALVRFSVHRNNVVTSLARALEETFPVARALVGAEFFAAMARAFARSHPPASPVLATYGDRLADFIEGFAPARGVPYLADVARLEALRVRAYHAADTRPMSRHELETLLRREERLPGIRFVLHPSVAVLASRFAVFSLWAAHQGALEITDVDPFRPEEVLIARPELEVQVTRLPAGGRDFVDSLAGAATLAQAADTASARRPPLELSRILTILIRAGALVRAELAGGDPR